MNILYGDEYIEFTRKQRLGDINRVLIKVYPDCSIVASAPPSASDLDVIDAVSKRARWIYSKRNQFKEQLAYITPRRYVSGESHYYLGKQYVLKVEKAATLQEQYVKLLRGKLEVCVKNKKNVKKSLFLWYKERAKEVFSRRLDELLPQALWVDGFPHVRVRDMKTQWGSCSPNGRITLNPHLVKASRECIDYVILHELCHIAEHNHSDKFYRLMKQVMPKWESVKERLDDKANYYLSV